MSAVGRNQTELVAQVDLFLTGDYGRSGKIIVVGGDDARAAILVARKGSVIPPKLAKQLGIDEHFKLETNEKAQASKPPSVAPEEISSRRTRPEKPALVR